MPTPAAAHPEARSYWIGVTSSDHVALAVAGGFTQLNHGKAGPLERMRAGDGFACYSPRTAYPDGERCRRSRRSAASRARLSSRPTGRTASCRFDAHAEYLPREPAPIRPLIDSLSFIRSKVHWGAAFRFGFLRVPEEDFARIAAAMGRDFSADFGEETQLAQSA